MATPNETVVSRQRPSKLYAGVSSIIIIHYYELIINLLRHQ